MKDSPPADELSRDGNQCLNGAGTQPTPDRRTVRWRLWAGGASLLVMLAAIAVSWNRFLGSPPPDPPHIELNGLPRAVADVIREARKDLVQLPGAHEAWGRLGMVLMAHRFDPEAVTCFVEAERLEPQEFRWPYLQGIVLSVHDRQTAIACYQRAISIRDDYPVARIRLAELLLDEGRLDHAESQLQAVLDVDPFEPRALLGMARVFSQRGDLEQALDCAQRSVKFADNTKPPHEFLANIYQRLGKRQEALRVLEEMPQEPMLWYDRYAAEVLNLRRDTDWHVFQAEQSLEQNQFQQAVQILEQALASDPDAPPHVYAILGRALYQSGQLTRAARELERGLRLLPQSPELRFHRGVVYFLDEEFPQAAARFREAIQRKPDYHLAHYNLGHSLRRMNKDQEALCAFRDAVRFSPDYVPAHYNLGKLLADLGQTSEAVEHAQKAVKIRPDDPESRQLLNELTTE